AGATFPYPIYSKWFSQYNKLHPNVEINYQSIGSGGGIRQFTARTVFFGATDGPMTNDQIFAAGAPILHLPTVLGGDVPVYNLPGNPDLRFTGPVLADIFLGKITKWNDAAIRSINPGVSLTNDDGPVQNAAGEFVRASTAPLPSEVVTLEMQALGRIRT
ncbi:MAG: hypothetical protein DMF59_10065, partial [Acidobacteria bacterium]